jgi:G3E family GTPase
VPSDILRAKGIVRFADSINRRSIVHMIGRRIEIAEDGPWRGDADSRLVLLGTKPMLQSLDKELETIWPAD